MSRVLVVGCGNVGSRLYDEIKALNPDRYDPYKGLFEKSGRYDLAFVCVDTPLNEKGLLDASAVETAVFETDSEIIVIKSTVPVGFTHDLSERTGRRIVFSPEYYGTTQHANDFNYSFTVLGGYDRDCQDVQNILQNVYNATHRFIWCDPKEAEIAKLMENAWIATKVDFCIGFYEACESFGASYDRVREIFVSDPRVSAAHTFVYKDHPFWKSHCLDKDVPAAANQLSIEQLSQIVDRNSERKGIYKRE